MGMKGKWAIPILVSILILGTSIYFNDAYAGFTQNIGLAATIGGVPDGNLVATLVDESSEGSDLNGDGDTNDFVPHVYDHTTGMTTNIGLAFSGFAFSLDGNLLAFHVFESAQGNTDLNGDGDTNDLVLHVYDHTAVTPVTNIGLATVFGFSQLDGNLVVIPVSEAGQGSDLNGDGDTNDRVLHVYDHVTGTTTNIGLAVGFGFSPLDGNLVAFAVNESDQGNTDLNGDGDTSDEVLHVYDHDTIAPVITLNGDDPVMLQVGGTYTEQGATVSDNDPAYTGTVTVGGDTVDANTGGT